MFLKGMEKIKVRRLCAKFNSGLWVDELYLNKNYTTKFVLKQQ